MRRGGRPCGAVIGVDLTKAGFAGADEVEGIRSVEDDCGGECGEGGASFCEEIGSDREPVQVPRTMSCSN